MAHNWQPSDVSRQAALSMVAFFCTLLLGAVAIFIIETDYFEQHKFATSYHWDVLNRGSGPLPPHTQEWLDALCPDGATESIFLEGVPRNESLDALAEACEAFRGDLVEEVTSRRLSFPEAVHAAMAMLSTVGDGFYMTENRAFCSLFIILGLPVTLTMMIINARLVSTGLLRAFEEVAGSRQHTPAVVLTAGAALAACGWLVLTVPAAALLYAVETANENQVPHDHTYGGWLYYAVVTLSTVGFGDIVPVAHQVPPRLDTGSLRHWFYLLFWVLWLTSALVYWASVGAFVFRGLAAVEKYRTNEKKREEIQHIIRVVKASNAQDSAQSLQHLLMQVGLLIGHI